MRNQSEQEIVNPPVHLIGNFPVNPGLLGHLRQHSLVAGINRVSDDPISG